MNEEIAFTLDDLTTYLMDLVLDYGPKVILSIITLIIGLRVIRWAGNTFHKLLVKREVDISLRAYAKSMLVAVLKVLLAISVMSMLGIEMTSFIAILGAAGLAVGMALSGTLQNFAGGVMILLFKPFKVGDFVELGGYSGTVKGIHIFNTDLRTPDNKIIIIPNNEISGSSMINYSIEETRRVDITVGVSYNENIKSVKETIRELIDQEERILKDPEPFIGVSGLGDNSVDLVLRLWVKRENFLPVFHDMLERIKNTFDEKGISLPYPQRDIHVYNEK